MTEEAGGNGSAEFAERLIGVLNAGMLALMTSLGHRTGLFDAMASLPPATSVQLAEASGLDERYVREWLGAMTTGGIVDHDPVGMRFVLPPERAAWLTRAAGPENLALQAQYVGLLAQVEDQIVGCFRHGGGVPYSEFPKFQAIMAEDSGAVHDATLVDITLPLVPGLVERLQRGIDVADVGCGSGHAINLMAEAFPASRFVGFDISEAGLTTGIAESERKRLTNVRFEQQTPPGWRHRSSSTSSPPSTRSTIKPALTSCFTASPSRSARTGSTYASTSPPRALWPTTSPIRSRRSCTRSPACTA